MAKKKESKKKRDKSLATDFLSVDYPPIGYDNPFPARGGSRIQHPNDVALDELIEKLKTKKK